MLKQTWDSLTSAGLLGGALASLIIVPLTALLYSFRKFLKKYAIELADAVQYALGRRLDIAISAASSMRTYCRLALKSPATSFLGVPGDDRQLRTDDVFVKLSLDGADESVFTTSNIFAAGTRLRVIGDPGSGKSSLIKRLFRDACRRGLARPRDGRLPIIVELKTLKPPATEDADRAGSWLLAECRSSVQAHQGFKMGELFDRCASSQGVMVLLDGLDEVATSEYERIRDAINDLSADLDRLGENNRLVLTMRVQFHAQTRDDFAAALPAVLTINRFSSSDIYEFLERWFKSSPSSIANAVEVHNELAAHPSLRDLCRNPLVLAMYVSNFLKVRKHDLPDTRTQFYTDVTDELLIRRRAAQIGSRKAKLAAKRLRTEILGSLALSNLLDPDAAVNTISRSDAVCAVRSHTDIQDDEVALDEFENLAKETGLVAPEIESESYRFIHRSFCEYFAAIEAARGSSRDEWHGVVRRHLLFSAGQSVSQSRLLDLIPFMVALLPARDQQAMALAELERIGDAELAGMCLLETQLYSEHLWPWYATAEASFLIHKPDADWDELWLRRLHLFQTVVTDAERAARENVRPRGDVDVDLFSFFSGLVGESRSRLRALFASYARESAGSAFRLAQSLGMNLVQEAPQLVIESLLQDAAFFGFALDEAGSCAAEDRAQWARILVEAAVTSFFIARVLSTTTAWPEWCADPHANDGPWKFVVGGRRQGPPSIYAVALAIGTSHHDEAGRAPVEGFPMDAALAALNLPVSAIRRYRGLAALGVILFFVLYFGSAVGVSALIISWGDESLAAPWSFVWQAGTALAAIVLAVGVMLRLLVPLACRRALRSLLLLRPDVSRFWRPWSRLSLRFFGGRYRESMKALAHEHESRGKVVRNDAVFQAVSWEEVIALSDSA